ncbi:MAG: carbonic anhydrase [Candidatus Paceibacterota bacterium]|jgi:carbonic anhydrase
MKKISTVIKCIDYRQDGFFKNWLKNNEWENSDIISVAGSVKELVGEKEEIRNWLLSMIKISHDGHGSREIVLTSHSTCGAYAIENEEEEKKIQLEDLEKAKAMIEKNFPDMKVSKFWLKLIGTHEETTDIIFNPID